MGGLILSVILASSLLYENDFSTRTSTDQAPGADWMVYTYDKGGPVAYDYEPSSSFNYYTGPYPFSDASHPYTQQDGWIKANTGSSVAGNYLRSSVSDEDDPALVFSDTDRSLSDVTNHEAIVYHTLRNVFTNGQLRAQFDVRQVSGWVTSKLLTWFRFMYDKDVMNKSSLGGNFPIEIGLSSSILSGGWRKADSADGDRAFYSSNTPGVFANKGFSAQALHWYRYYVTCDLDTMKSSFEVYDLGLNRIPMDSHPAGSPIGQNSDLLFRKNMTASTGGISCFAIRVNYCDTLGLYGESTFNEDYAYKYDNIRISWKAPNDTSFVDCYRNDFSKSMRRVVNGSSEKTHTYQAKAYTDTSTYTYPAALVRSNEDYTVTGKPYLTMDYKDSLANKVNPASVDGWRLAGCVGYKGTIAVTTNGANRMAILTNPAMVMQPMCPDVTNGLVKFEYDTRMPKSFNKKSTFVALALFGNKIYEEETNIVNSNTLIRVGICSSDGNVTGSPTFVTSNDRYLSASYNKEWVSKVKPLDWYRLQIFVDLDKGTYQLFIYDLGTSSPLTPETFDSSDTNTATFVSAKSPLFANPACERKVGAYGFTSWNDGNADHDCAIYFDNVRLWKQDGEDWTLLFRNDFSSSKRTYTRQAVRLNPSGYLDRPEHDEDFWTSTPTYNSATYVAGKDAMLDPGYNIFSIVHPLGRTIRNGHLTAQYDLRVPNFWCASTMTYFWLQFGGGGLSSASTWTYPKYRYQGCRSICTGLQMGQNGSAGLTDDLTGVNNRSVIVARGGDGSGSGSDTVVKTKHITTSFNNHWIRIRIDADVGAHTYSCTAYDMGTTHPTFATPDGSEISDASWKNLNFPLKDPITHIHLIGGRNPSYAPWRDDLPGALVVDNIRVYHEKQGLTILVR